MLQLIYSPPKETDGLYMIKRLPPEFRAALLSGIFDDVERECTKACKTEKTSDVANLVASAICHTELKYYERAQDKFIYPNKDEFGLLQSFQIKCVAMALSLGADANFAPNDDSPLLMGAIRNGSADLVKLLLVHGAFTNDDRDYCFFPIERALNQNDGELIQILLDAGADPNAGLPPGWFIALDCDSVQFLPLLFEYGASTKSLGFNGMTALHWCACQNEIYPKDMFEVVFNQLVEQGVDLLARDESGHTAQQIALMHNQTAVLHTIDAYIAQFDAQTLHRETNKPLRVSPAKRL